MVHADDGARATGATNTDSHGILIEGGAGAWTLQLAGDSFKSATLSPIPGSSTKKQLMVKMRDYWVAIDPAIQAGPRPRPGE